MAYRLNLQNNAIYYDLHDDKLSYVEVRKDGWEVRRDGTEYFISGSGERRQVSPIPDNGGIDRIDKYLNLSDDAIFLFKICVVCCLHPQIIVPILYFIGERGTGKSAMLEILGELVDPSISHKLNFDAMSDRDMGLILSKTYLASFDNISKISRSKSDILCQSITGGGQSFRKLYTDSDMCYYDMSCRVAISAIEDCVQAEDLAERTLYFEAEHIQEYKRKDEVNFWESFKEDKPYILGDIFELLSQGLEFYPRLRKKLKRRHRLASFDEFGYAVASVLEIDGGERFMALMDENAHRQLRLSEQDTMFIKAIEGVMDLDNSDHYETEMRNLYNATDMYVNDMETEAFNGFELGNYDAFAKRLHRVKPYLQRFGLNATFSRTPKDNVSYVTIDRCA